MTSLSIRAAGFLFALLLAVVTTVRGTTEPFTLNGDQTPRFSLSFGTGTLVAPIDPRLSLATTGDNPTIYTLSASSENAGGMIEFVLDTNITNSGSIAFVGASPPGVTLTVINGDQLAGTLDASAPPNWDVPLVAAGSPGDIAILRRATIPEPISVLVVLGLGVALVRRSRVCC